MGEIKTDKQELSAKKNIKKWEIILYVSILALYAAVNIYLMSCHEAWIDEAQAWVLAKQLSWTQIPGLCASEGHPVLWFYILKITILLGLPFRYFSVISIFFMTLALGVFLFRSDFNPVSKILVVLSPLFFYYNPVICRNYSVLMLFVCLLSALWKNRHDKPILYGVLAALLFQTHVLIFGLAIGFTLEIFVDLIANKKHRGLKHICGLLIPFASFVLMLMELRQRSGSKNFINITPDYLLNRVKDGNWLSRLMTISFSLDYENIRVGVAVLLVTFISLIAFLFLALDKDFRKKFLYEGLVYLCGIGVYLGIVLFVRDIGHIQMAIVLCMIILFFCWVMREAKKGIVFEIMLLLMCVPLIPKSLYFDTYYDIRQPFSGSKEIAKIINDNVEDGSVIMINNHFLCTPVIAYLSDSPKNYVIWDLENNKQFVIHKWGETYPDVINESNIAEYADKIIKENGFTGNIYYVKCNEYLPTIKDGKILVSGFFREGTVVYVPEVQPNDRLELIDKNRTLNYWNEYYLLYRFKTQA